jgi:hypothetical protein
LRGSGGGNPQSFVDAQAVYFAARATQEQMFTTVMDTHQP